jgi:hypothetical protein
MSARRGPLANVGLPNVTNTTARLPLTIKISNGRVVV